MIPPPISSLYSAGALRRNSHSHEGTKRNSPSREACRGRTQPKLRGWIAHLLIAMLTSSLGVSTAYAQNSLSKSVEQGWNSVIKDASKAAKTVTKEVTKATKGATKAASEALGNEKPKKRGAKPKPGTASSKKSSPSESAKSSAPPDEKSSAPPDKDAAEAEAWASEPEHGKKPVRKTKAAKEQPAPPAPTKNVAAPSGPPSSWTAERKDEDAADENPSRKATNDIPSVDVVPIRPTIQGDAGAPVEPKLPITMIPPKQDKPEADANRWPQAEIEAAKANCAALLKSIDAVTIAEAPVREGGCGTPAPVRLVSIGKNPAVTLTPAPLVTCDLVAGLHDWMKNDIQPLARRKLGGPVVKIETMSDYSCRMAYGRKGNKLSEHGRANALDIRAFVTGKGETANLLSHWGKTERDLAAEAAAKAATRKAADDAANAAAAAGAKSATVHDASNVTVSLPSGAIRATSQANLGALPGRHNQTEAHAEDLAAPMVTPPEPQTRQSAFLHEAHESACEIFGTTLGPEANEAHRNHFHVDMAPRKRSKICE